MRFRYLAFLGLLTFALPACSSGDPAEAEREAWDRVMEAHDAAMPQMGALNSTKVDLRSVLEGNEGLEEDTRAAIENTIDQITEAQNAMMTWMNDLKKPLASLQAEMDHEAVLDYLSQEQANIETVQRAMDEALERGRNLLEQHGTNG